ncbi:MAG: hypothetical protein ACT4O1_15505 [Gemmatimonadota bacterium]
MLLTGDNEWLAIPNGRVMVMNALRLLLRICSNVVVDLRGAPCNVVDEMRAEARRIEFDKPVEFVEGSASIRLMKYGAV